MSEGMMHNQAAEVSDAPMLILRLAQTKAEWSKLHSFLRVDTGLGSEGQISHAMLKQGLARCGMHPTVPAMHVDELFAVLDPEATGTIGFSELMAELRRVRKLVAAPPSPQRRMQRGGSAPISRQRAPGGLAHEDGSAF